MLDVAYVGDSRAISYDSQPQPDSGRRRDSTRRIEIPRSPTAGESQGAAGCVPAADPRLRRHQHQRAGEYCPVRLAAGTGQPPVHRRFELAGSYTRARGTDAGFRATRFPERSRLDLGLQDHVLVTSYQVELPNGGRVLGNSAVARGILDDWRVSGISTFATGLVGRHSPTAQASTSRAAAKRATAPVASRSRWSATRWRAPRTEDRWFDTSVFQPATGRNDRGTTRPATTGKFQLPGFHNHDVSFFKDFP